MINSRAFQTFMRLRDAYLYMEVICFILPFNMLVFSPDESRTSKLEQREQCHSF